MGRIGLEWADLVWNGPKLDWGGPNWSGIGRIGPERAKLLWHEPNRSERGDTQREKGQEKFEHIDMESIIARIAVYNRCVFLAR